MIFISLMGGLINAHAIEKNESEYFRVNLINDGILLGGGILLNAGDIVIQKMTEPENGRPLDSLPAITRINIIDRLYILRYSEPIDSISDILSISSLLAPALLLSAPSSEWHTIGIMYTESIIWTWGLKELGKNLVHRNRPYMYFDGYPENSIPDGDFRKSFPSGHSALAFNGAGFCTFLFNKYFPDSSWKIPVIAGSYSLAVGSSILRVAGGSHYLSDVLAGAAIGTFTGFIIPWMHTWNAESSEVIKSGTQVPSVTVTHSSIHIRLNF